MRGQRWAWMGALAIVVGCRQESTAERAADVQKADAEVVDERKDVDEATRKLDDATKRFHEEKGELADAERDAKKARDKLAEQARKDSAAVGATPRR